MSTDPHLSAGVLSRKSSRRKGRASSLAGFGKICALTIHILFGPANVNHDNLYMHSFSFAKVLKINDQAVTACTIANGFAVNESRGWRSCVQDLCQRQLLTNRLRRIA
jgi:hypothetical protein